MDNATRRQLLQRHKSSGFKGSIIDVFRAYDQGIDLIGQYEQMQVANTQQEQQQGLRPQHQAGNTNASMAFPNQPPNASFNTVGMKAPIDMKQFDNRGNLVMSYDKVPPGVTDLKMSSQGGTVIETPAKMQSGGVKKYQTGSFVAESTYRPNYGEQAFLNQLNTAPIQERVLTTNQEFQGAITQAPDEDPETMPVYKMLAEPMKALEYWRSDYNRERGIPTQAEWDAFGDRNPYDLATSMYNPAQMAVDYSENGAFATLPGLATADDLIKAAGTFKNYGITNAHEAGQLAYNLRNGRVEGVAEELANAGSVINQGAANAKQFYQDAIPAYSPYTSGSYYLNRLADNTLARHPELAATYKPGMMGSQATINATDDFAERYLTSYRGVRANSPEQAAEYLTSPFGRGNRAFGEGIYSAPNPEAAMQHGDYVGQLLADPQFVRGQDPRYTMGRIDHLRVEGGKHRLGLPSMLGKDTYDQISNALQKGADLNRDVSEILGTSNASSFLASKGYDIPDFRTGFMDDAGQRVQRGTTEGRLKPKLVQMGRASEFKPTVQTIWDDLNSGIDYRDPTQLFFKEQGFKKYGGVRKYQTGGQIDNTRVATPQPPQYQLNPLPPSPYRDQGTITPDKSSFNAWRDEDSLFENAVEFFDPTGITSWDDARRAYNSMKNRGASIPNLDEGLDMFGAIPLFGRAKLGINLAKGAAKRSKDVVNAAKKGYNYLTKGSDIINRVDAIEDEVGFLDKKQFGGIKKHQTGGQVDTLYVNTPDHPRIQQYADSSYAYNMGLQGQAKAVAESQKLLDEYNNRNKFTGSHKAFGQTSSINTNTSNTIKGLQPSSTQKINYMAPAPYDPSINVPVKIPVPGPNTFQSGIVYSLWDKPKQPVVYRPELQQMDKINPSAISQSTPNASLKPVGKYVNSTRPPQTMYKQDPSVSTGQYPIGEYLWDSNSRRWKTDTWDTEMQKASRQLAIPRGYKLGGIRRK